MGGDEAKPLARHDVANGGSMRTFLIIDAGFVLWGACLRARWFL
jgi:hypothetical protein